MKSRDTNCPNASRRTAERVDTGTRSKRKDSLSIYFWLPFIRVKDCQVALICRLHLGWQLFVSLLKVPSFESGGLLNRLVSQTLKTKGQACYDTINGMYGNGVFRRSCRIYATLQQIVDGLHLPPCQTPNLLDTLASAGNIDSIIGPHNHFFSISSRLASCTAKSKSEPPELLQDIKMPFLTVLAAPRRSSWVIEAEVRFFL